MKKHPVLRAVSYLSRSGAGSRGRIAMAAMAAEASFSPMAYSKMMLHITRHAETSVNGYLLGHAMADGAVAVEDAVPLFHTQTLAPMLEVATHMVADRSEGRAIVGYYFANERLNDRDVPILAERVVTGLESKCPGAILVQIVNERLRDPEDHALQAWARSGKQGVWIASLGIRSDDASGKTMQTGLKLATDAIAESLHLGFYDFDDHLADVTKNPLNPDATARLRNLCAERAR